MRKAMEIIRLGGLYDEGEKKNSRGELFCVEGLSPTINTCGGGYGMPLILEREETDERQDKT